MGENKNQHYVPQSYLRHFATPETARKSEGKQRIHVSYKRGSKGPSTPLIKDIATGRWFYDFRGEEGLDKDLRGIETKAGLPLKKLVTTGDLSEISFEERRNLSRFISVQHIRTKKHRDFYEWDLRSAEALYLNPALRETEESKDFVRNNFGKYALEAKNDLDIEAAELAARKLEVLKLPQNEREKLLLQVENEFEEFNSRRARADRYVEQIRQGYYPKDFAGIMPDKREVHLIIMRRMTPIIDKWLMNMYWVVYKNPTKIPLVTSDSPVFIMPLMKPADDDDHDADFYYNLTMLGYVDFTDDPQKYPLLAIQFPLSPSLMLVIGPVPETGSTVMDEKHVRQVNMLLAIQAHDAVYSSCSDFSFVPKAKEASEFAHKLIDFIPVFAEEHPFIPRLPYRWLDYAHASLPSRKKLK